MSKRIKQEGAGSPPLSPAVIHILLALAEGEKHGYAIMLEADRLSEGQVRLGPGTLYGSIKKLLAAGMIEESDARPDPELDDERRRYYRLTEHGQGVLAAETERLARLVRVARARHVMEPAPVFRLETPG